MQLDPEFTPTDDNEEEEITIEIGLSVAEKLGSGNENLVKVKTTF